MISFKNYISPQIFSKYLNEYFDRKIDSYSYKKNFAGELQHLHDNRKKLIKKMVSDILSGKYVTQPATLKEVRVEGKIRKIYHSVPQDDLLCFILQKAFSDISASIYHSNLYSYQKGISKLKPAQEFCSYIKKHVKNTPDVKQRGLFVLRRDIKAYGENILVTPDSELWKQLDKAIELNFIKDEYFEPVKKLIFELLTPIIRSEGDQLSCNLYGVADGNSLSCVLLNLYLSTIDEEMYAIYGGFYARYGDDMIFAHPKHEAALKASEKLAGIVQGLKLEFSTRKSVDYYFNGAGKKYCDENFLPAQKIDYLGNTINFKGKMEIRNDKLNDFLREVKIRIRSTSKVFGRDAESKLNIYSKALEDILDPSNPSYSKYYNELRTLNSKSQIKEIDYRLRLMILRETTGDNSVRLLRKFSFKKLINSYGIRSFKDYINKQI